MHNLDRASAVFAPEHLMPCQTIDDVRLGPLQKLILAYVIQNQHDLQSRGKLADVNEAELNYQEAKAWLDGGLKEGLHIELCADILKVPLENLRNWCLKGNAHRVLRSYWANPRYERHLGGGWRRRRGEYDEEEE